VFLLLSCRNAPQRKAGHEQRAAGEEAEYEARQQDKARRAAERQQVLAARSRPPCVGIA
jgi:hypothetical protein